MKSEYIDKIENKLEEGYTKKEIEEATIEDQKARLTDIQDKCREMKKKSKLDEFKKSCDVIIRLCRQFKSTLILYEMKTDFVSPSEIREIISWIEEKDLSSGDEAWFKDETISRLESLLS